MARRQTLVQLTDALLAALDQRAVQEGKSRSELIRDALEAYLAEGVEAEIDRQIVEGYSRIPQEESPWDEVVARETIGEEPW